MGLPCDSSCSRYHDSVRALPTCSRRTKVPWFSALSWIRAALTTHFDPVRVDLIAVPMIQLPPHHHPHLDPVRADLFAFPVVQLLRLELGAREELRLAKGECIKEGSPPLPQLSNGPRTCIALMAAKPASPTPCAPTMMARKQPRRGAHRDMIKHLTPHPLVLYADDSSVDYPLPSPHPSSCRCRPGGAPPLPSPHPLSCRCRPAGARRSSCSSSSSGCSAAEGARNIGVGVIEAKFTAQRLPVELTSARQYAKARCAMSKPSSAAFFAAPAQRSCSGERSCC